MKISMTRDYSKFKILNGNREVKPAHVNRLVQSMKEKELMTPLIVNEKMEIIDGQNRFMARKELGLEIPYFVVDGYGLDDVQRMNEKMNNWTPADYVHAFCELGNNNYIVLRDFQLKHKFSYKSCSVMLTGSQNAAKAIKVGKFKVSSLGNANLFAARINSIGVFYGGYKKHSFVSAFATLMTHKNYDHKKMLQNVERLQCRMIDCPTIRDYLRMLVSIYNNHLKQSNRILMDAA